MNREELPAPTIPSRVAARAESMPDAVALRHKNLGIWREITWSTYWESVQLLAHGLIDLGTEPGDRVAIHSENRPEWMIADVATVAAGAITVGMYPTNPSAEVHHLLTDSGAKVLVCEDQEQVDKALEVADELPELRSIVYIEPRGVREYDDPRLIWWPDLLERGRAHRDAHPDLLADRAAAAIGDDVVALIYTSGTTGPPKGAMLTAANVNFALETLLDGGGIYETAGPDSLTVSYLPLAHIADRLASEWCNAHTGAVVHFAGSVDQIAETLREVQPTLFLAVPRIWEKLRATVEVRMASASRLKRLNYRFWMGQAARIGQARADNGGAHTTSSRLGYALGYPFLFRALRDRLGLRKCREAICGAAPIAPELLQWFLGIGVPVREVYGMTENCAVATVNRPGRVQLGTVGEPLPGIELRLDPDAGGDPDEAEGEILTRHPAVFAGYWGRPEATAATLSEDGWLRTGDVGQWAGGETGGDTPGTHLRIVDRIKDIIITAGGKNVSPSEIENALKFSPYVKEAVVIGDRRPYLIALIGIEAETVGDWARRQGLTYSTYRDLSERAEVLELLQGVIAEVNERFARVEQIKSFRVIVEELAHEDGRLTATQKVKRGVVAERMSVLIEDAYGGGREHAGGDASGVHGSASGRSAEAADEAPGPAPEEVVS